MTDVLFQPAGVSRAPRVGSIFETHRDALHRTVNVTEDTTGPNPHVHDSRILSRVTA
jgi:hypothetical protein